MGVDKISNMHIVADAGSIGRRIVLAEDGDVRTPSQRDFEANWNEMGFGSMVLAEAPAFVRARHIEVAQRDCRQRGGIVDGGAGSAQHGLKLQLRRAVGIDRSLRGGLGDGHRLRSRLAIGRRRRGEDDAAHARFAHRPQQRDAARGVGGEVVERALHALADISQCRKVKHRLDLPIGQGPGQRVGVGKVSLDEGQPVAASLTQRIDRPAMTAKQVVDDGHRMPVVKKTQAGMGADEAGTAGDQRSHGGKPGWKLRWKP